MCLWLSDWSWRIKEYTGELICFGKCRMYNKLDISHTIEFFSTLCNTEWHQESHYNYLLYLFIRWFKCTYQLIEIWWYIYALLFYILRPRQNGCHFADNIFECIEWKLSNLNYNLIELCSLGSNWQYGSIGSGNGLAPNMRQAIIWTNDDLGYWCIYTSLGVNEQWWVDNVYIHHNSNIIFIH